MIQDPLARALEATRLHEEELPSAPIASSSRTRSPQPPPALIEAVSKATRLVLITCLANGRFFSLEPGKDWLECGGELGVTPLDSGLFAVHTMPNDQLAFEHAATGKFLQANFWPILRGSLPSFPGPTRLSDEPGSNS